MPDDRRPTWQLFVRASILVGMVGGFATGSLLFASLLFDFGIGLWWPATAQAHGHAQLYGWAGLMIIGVGLHFLPRLASQPEVDAGQIRLGFWFLVPGLTIRLVSRPVMVITEPDGLSRIAEYAWTIGAAGEFVGVALLVAALAGAMLAGRSLPASPAVRPLIPLFGVAFLSLAAVSGSTLILGLLRLPTGDLPIDRASIDHLNLVMFYGFLIPVSVAMSARLFPLYVRTGPAKPRPLQAGLVLLVAGTGIRLNANWFDLVLLGRLFILAAILSFAAGTGIFGRRRELPRRPMRFWQDPTGLHALSAYVWLICAAAVQILGDRGQGAEFHLLGMGFVTLLIFGMGAHLIPGFSRRRMRGTGYLWATLALGNLAVIGRLTPAIPGLSLPAALERTAGVSAGIAGLLALALFAVNAGGMSLWRSGNSSGAPDPA